MPVADSEKRLVPVELDAMVALVEAVAVAVLPKVSVSCTVSGPSVGTRDALPVTGAEVNANLDGAAAVIVWVCSPVVNPVLEALICGVPARVSP